MGREQGSVEGRDDVLAALRDGPRASAARGRSVVLRGQAGIGKTRLMEAAGKRWRTDGIRVIDVRWNAAGARHGFDAVLDAVRREFSSLRGDAGLIDRIAALSRLCASPADAPGWASAVIAGFGEVFERIGALGPTAVLVDDAAAAADPLMLMLVVRRPGCLVLSSVRDEAAGSPAAAELLALADDVFDLEPLSGAHVAAVTGDELGEDVHRSLRAALGPLYGNPGAVLAAVRGLRERGRLVDGGGGGLVLADPAEPIALPAAHDLPRRVRELGPLGPRMLAAAATLDGLDIEELPSVAEALGEQLVECGRIVDRLVELGALTGDSWDDVACLCPALGAWAEAADPDAPRALRAAGVAVSRLSVPGPRRPAARTERPAPTLSRTEARIVEMVGAGLTNRRIGSALNLSEKTVEGYLTRLFARTGCNSRVELVAANLHGRLDSGAARGIAA
ncbi:helix-turn-helix transcriptional regulator [Saccharopolyspora gregorii]|uniref:helix-turn-helix transcriptional regulator n=1 Tax=Saccharopolyspora gregorii TaxID=33914 RepID=UPI0021AC3733|nr:LuxR family transcriptional regulator [Saccharopolyspora gregorii]